MLIVRTVLRSPPFYREAPHTFFCFCSFIEKPTAPENGTHHTAFFSFNYTFYIGRGGITG